MTMRSAAGFAVVGGWVSGYLWALRDHEVQSAILLVLASFMVWMVGR